MKKLILLICVLTVSLTTFTQTTGFKFHEINSIEPLSAEMQAINDSLLTQDEIKKENYKSDCSEMLYYLYNFEDQAKRNANINWDRGYVRSVKWIEWTLCKKTEIFPKEVKNEIIRDLKRIRQYRKPYTEDDLYNHLRRRIIEYFLNNQCTEY